MHRQHSWAWCEAELMNGWEARPPDGPQSQRPKDASSQALAEWVTHGEQRRGRRADHRHSDRPGCSGGRGPSGILHQELPHPVDTTMLLIALLFVSSTLAADCRPDGDHAATCQTGKCETVGSSEICTQCRAGGAPIDGFCRPVGSPQVIAAGCTKGDGTALEQTAATCGKCGSEYFLFMGGCYKAGQGPGSEICTAARDGRCTACKTDNGLFQNPAATVSLGSECVLCSDTTERDGITGVKGCAQCIAPDSNAKGAATCTECAVGSYKSDNACLACAKDCASCTGAGQCTTCNPGTYLKDNACVTDCAKGFYGNRTNGQCKACTDAGSQCAACTYSNTLQKAVCSECSGGGTPLLKVSPDGSATCVNTDGCAQNAVEGTHFLTKASDMCLPCSDVSIEGEPANKGVEGCGTCKKADPSQNVACTACVDGYYDSDDGPDTATCVACGENCATCVKATKDLCTTCKSGFFMKGGGPGECFPCDDTANGGGEGCGVCSGNSGFECTGCKPNYRQTGAGSGSVACTKVCEDETACGGTAGACDATVVDENGITRHYCSFCGESSKFPIDGVCVGDAKSNTCGNHICTACTTGYFLYMGGCYRYDAAPGSHVCSASAAPGVCSAPNPNNQFFVVPGAANNQQSVLACGNPLGTAVGDRTYVGVEGCSRCTAPARLDAPGIASATCTACGEGRKPNKSGTGCAVCSVENCKHCRVDSVCEECSSGFGLEGGKCISTGTSGGNRSGLSTGAIAGIAVAVVIVVGGLVGFLCWWFLCRGKA